MTVTLSPEIQSRIQEKAAREGRDAFSLVEELIATALNQEARQKEKDRALLDAALAGPSKPQEQVIAEFRAKHGLPENWPDSEEYQMTDADWQVMDRLYAEGKLHDS